MACTISGHVNLIKTVRPTRQVQEDIGSGLCRVWKPSWERPDQFLFLNQLFLSHHNPFYGCYAFCCKRNQLTFEGTKTCRGAALFSASLPCLLMNMSMPRVRGNVDLFPIWSWTLNTSCNRPAEGHGIDARKRDWRCGLDGKRWFMGSVDIKPRHGDSVCAL